jgi:hypothetical protein
MTNKITNAIFEGLKVLKPPDVIEGLVWAGCETVQVKCGVKQHHILKSLGMSMEKAHYCRY